MLRARQTLALLAASLFNIGLSHGEMAGVPLEPQYVVSSFDQLLIGGGGGRSVNVYVGKEPNGSNKQGTLVFAPVPCFDRDSDGRLRAAVEPSSDGKFVVVIPVRLAPFLCRQDIKRMIMKRSQEDARYSEVAAKAGLIPTAHMADVLRCEIRSSCAAASFKDSHVVGKDQTGSEILVESVPLQKSEAAALADRIRSGEAPLECDLTLTLAAVHIQNSSFLRITQQAVREALGKVARDTGSQSIGAKIRFLLEGSQLEDPTVVLTGAESTDLKGSLARILTVEYYSVEQSGIKDAIPHIQNVLESELFKRVSIDLSKEFTDEEARLMALSISPDDLSSDELNVFKAGLKDARQGKEGGKIQLKSGTAVEVPGIVGVKGDMDIQNEKTREFLESRGWEFEQQGSRHIPKSVRLTSLARSSLSCMSTVSMNTGVPVLMPVTLQTVIKTNRSKDIVPASYQCKIVIPPIEIVGGVRAQTDRQIFSGGVRAECGAEATASVADGTATVTRSANLFLRGANSDDYGHDHRNLIVESSARVSSVLVDGFRCKVLDASVMHGGRSGSLWSGPNTWTGNHTDQVTIREGQQVHGYGGSLAPNGILEKVETTVGIADRAAFAFKPLDVSVTVRYSEAEHVGDIGTLPEGCLKAQDAK